ncbi:related to ribosomal protein MRP49 [Rhynchosporium agropyri]|uniref:Related to ribosomal protein MRP49 n=2 Tax=Rhynchosporium TaxID=38037 RepID=A0A1E1KKX8_9HELO|nr:related to ribosomal protein MRP49 [Rhynchosporium agropyri]CZT08762.1 related to ribosomal protein MRP49 [Rhynchosporium commune]
MVAIVTRMRKLRALLAIRIGPGAAILPPEVTRIHMDFARAVEDGHYGPRKFWRHCLPRLKYHNPAIPMTVNRTNDQTGPALMTIHFTTPEAAETIKTEISSTTTKQTSSAPVAATKAGPPTERTEVINMKHRPESEILDQLLAVTRARVLKPTAEDLRQVQEIEEQDARSERDAIMMAEVNAKRKREEAIMTQARGNPDAVTS